VGEVDRRALAVLGWIAALVGATNGVAHAAGLRWLEEVAWPSDLYTFDQLDPAPIDVAVVGSSRSHFGLPPSALDLCLGEALGRRTRTVGLNRLTANGFAEDVVARELLADPAPRVLVVEVAPETLAASHFEGAYNVASTAALRDVPECLAHGYGAGCARPLFRGVENVAQLFDRPFDDRDHVAWMMTYAGGGQYCYDDDACRARNAEYDHRKRGRWQARMDTLIPSVRAGRFADYDVASGISVAHFRALLARSASQGVEVVVVNPPVARVYQDQIPPEVYATYLAAMAPLGERFVDLNTPAWQGDRAAFLDPDHLNSVGAEKLARELCEGTLAQLIDD
jgi:hypothetical protein